MAFWSRKVRRRPERVHAEPDPLLDISLADVFVPPQKETLFDADQYVADFAPREPGAGFMPRGEAGSGPAPGTAPQGGAGAERASGPGLAEAWEPAREAGSEHEADEDSAPGDEHGFEPADVPAGEWEDVPAAESEDVPHSALATHARRRAHGRSMWSRLTRSKSSEDPERAPAAAAAEGSVAPVHARHGRLKRAKDGMSSVGKRAISVALIIVLLLGAAYALPLLADGINWLARWNKLRSVTSTTVALPAQDNLLVIGVSDGVVVGFVALKAERSSSKVLGIAIPDGAFVEVPGQGFERVGASYLGGPQVSEDAISNFFGVPFRKYVVVDGTAYQALLRNQDVSTLMQAVASTDLTTDERAAFTSYFGSVGTKDVWIVPLPVKPVAVGDQRYFEPQKAEIADLLLQWWGVQASQTQSTPRVIVYNGVGTPGLAGVAAQQLIRAGYRIVDSGNAANFEYVTTEIHLFHGTQADAEAVRAVLGVGRIIVESAPQDLTDMIVIVGADYRPPTADISTVPTVSTVPTEGVQ